MSVTPSEPASHSRTAPAWLVLMALATTSFLMTLDSSVMNVSMPQVAADTGTTITGVQTAITLYTLVMATTMIAGGKIGTNIGRRRAFAIGCVIYGAGSFVTAIASTLPVLILGWSVLEGIGAALILPANVALVSGNFPVEQRPRAYGLVSASAAIAIAVGPLLGGLATTFASWRWVFAGEVVLVAIILILLRRVADAPSAKRSRIDIVGALLSGFGLGLAVFGVLRSDEWGWTAAKPGGPSILGLSPTPWFIVVGLVVVWAFIRWEHHMIAVGREPLLQPGMFGNRTFTAGLTMSFFEYLVQAGVFFIVPLFLSVVLALSAIETGLRVLPLSVALLISALGIPRLWPNASPRTVVRIGMLLVLSGILSLAAGMDVGASAAIVGIPMFLMGLGVGCLASQLGAVTVSAFPDEMSGEVGGVQNTATNLGASLGTALAGSILIAILTSSAIAGIQQNADVPADVQAQATVELASGVPFLSDAQLEQGMTESGASAQLTQSVVQINAQARVDGLRAALLVLALLTAIGLFMAERLPTLPAARRAVDAT